MNLKKLTDQAKKHADKLIEQRGGQDALKRDAQQVSAVCTSIRCG